jgi:type II secretion system protein N
MKSFWSLYTPKERIAQLAIGGVMALLLLLWMLDVLGTLLFVFLFFFVLVPAGGYLPYRVKKRADGVSDRKSLTPTTPLGKRLLRAAAYSSFFTFCFLGFAYLTFPYDRLKDFIIQEVERPMGPGDVRVPSGTELEIVDLSPSFLTGVDLEGVRLTKVADEPDGEPMTILIDEASARISLRSLLVGDLGVSYDVVVGGGTIEGDYETDDETQHVEAEIEDVNLLSLGFVRSAVGLPVRGKLGGTIDVTLGAEPAQSTGSVKLAITGLQIGDGRAKLAIGGMRDGITIERIDAGDLNVELVIEEGVARVEELTANGPDIELAAGGTIRLAQPVDMSRLDLLLRFKFQDGYRERNDRTRALFSLVDLTPQLRSAKTNDGALQYRINGSLGGRIGTTPAGRAPAP